MLEEQSVSPVIWLSAELLAVVGGPALLAWWIRRRYAASWSSLGWGALAFVASQAVRLPLLIGATLLFNPLLRRDAAAAGFWINFALLALTSGLFEEGARYLVMRGAAKRVRRWNEALMFGAGHGGIEAVLVVGLSVVGALVLLTRGDQLIEQLRVNVPAQADALAAQLAELRAAPAWTAALAIWERALAITLHIGLSILVMRAVRDRRLALLLLAMALHAAFNALALLVLRYAGILAAEAVLTLLTGVPLWIILRTRAQEAAHPPAVEPTLG